MIGQVEANAYGSTLRQGLLENGVEIQGCQQIAFAETRVAVILVGDSGQNRIL